MLSVQKYFDIEWVDSPLINQYNYKVSSSKMRKLFAFPNFGAKDYYDPRIYHKRLLPQGSVYECIEETLKALRNINL